MRKFRDGQSGLKTKGIGGTVSGRKRYRLLPVLFLLFALLLSACGSGASTSSMSQADKGVDNAAAVAGGAYGESSMEGIPEVAPDMEAPKSEGGIGQAPSAPEELGRKIIRDGRVEMETIGFEQTVNDLYRVVAEKGGFVESQTIQGGRYNYSALRRADIVIRIPAAEFDGIMNTMETFGTVVSKSSSGTDITDQYADTESRVRNLKVQETRILELIAKAEKLEEIVTLEARLSDLRYQIESYENSLKNFDRLLTFSRISLSVSEVQRITDVKPVPKTLTERLSQAFDHAWNGFLEGAQDFAVWVVESMFGLILLAIFAFIVWRIIRASNRKHRKNKEAWLAAHPQQAYPQQTYPQGQPMQAHGQGQPMQSHGPGQPVQAGGQGQQMQAPAAGATTGAPQYPTAFQSNGMPSAPNDAKDATHAQNIPSASTDVDGKSDGMVGH